MSRTYPAKRSKIAKGFDFPGCSDWGGSHLSCTCQTWETAVCPECGEDIEDGQRIVEDMRWNEREERLMYEALHSACANEGSR
ncbi:hypothetical protein ACFVW2_32915 [Streptomyces sp. NPDC058171]